MANKGLGDSNYSPSNDMGIIEDEGYNPLEGFTPDIPEQKGPITGLLSGLYKGTKYGLPEQIAKASQWFGLGGEAPEDIAQRVSEYGRAGLGDEKVGAFEEAGRMIPQSIGLPLILTGAGKLLMRAPHLGAKAAGAGLVALGKGAAYATPLIFGGAQAQQTRETARERGVDEGLAPYLTGAVEAIGESAGTFALLRLFKPLGIIGSSLVSKAATTGARAALKGTIWDFLKQLTLVTAPTEIGTEIGQNALEAMIEQRQGIRPEADPWQEAMDVVGPTAIMTALVGGGAGMLNNHVAARQADLLAAPINTTNPEAADYIPRGSEEYALAIQNRLDIASNIEQVIPKKNQPLRNQWRAYAEERIKKNEAIDVEAPLDALGLEIDSQMKSMPEEYDAVTGEYAGMNWGGVAGAGLGLGGEAGIENTVAPGRVAPGFESARGGIATPGQVAAAQDVYGRKLPAAMAQIEAAGQVPVEPRVTGAATGVGGIGPAPNIPMAPTAETQGALDLAAAAPAPAKKAAKKKAPAKVATGLGVGGKTAAEEEPYISGVGIGIGGMGKEWVEAAPEEAKPPAAAPEEKKPPVETPAPAAKTVRISDKKAVEQGLEMAVVSNPTVVKHANGKYYVKNPDGSYTVNPATQTIFFDKKKDATATFQASGKPVAPAKPVTPEDTARNKFNLAKAAHDAAVAAATKWNTILSDLNAKKITLKSLAQEFGGKVPKQADVLGKAQAVNDELTKRRDEMEKLSPTGVTPSKPVAKKAAKPEASETTEKTEEQEPEGGVDRATIASNIAQMKDSELLSKTGKELWRDARTARKLSAAERKEAERLLKAHNNNPAAYLKARIDKAKAPAGDKYAKMPDNAIVTLARGNTEGAIAEAARRGLKLSTTAAGGREGISAASATTIKDSIVGSIKNCPKIHLLEKADGLPQWIKDYAKTQDIPLSTIDGVYDEQTGEVYAVLENIKTTRQLARVILHELTHKGLAGFFARHKGTPGLGAVNLAYNIFMDKTYTANTNAIKAVVFSTHGHIDLSTKAGQRAAAEEWIANQTYRLQPKLYDRLVVIYKDVIRKLGLDKYLGSMSDSEIRVLVRDSFKEFGLRPSDHAQGGKFSRTIDKGSRVLREGGLPGRRTIAQIAALLQRRTPIDHANATARQNHEVEMKLLEFLDTCIERLPRAVGWYRRDFSKAMSILERLDPSILTPEGNLMMRGAIALASNGNKTDPTIEVAYSAYKNWRETGELVPTFTGARHDVNVANMRFFQALYKTFNSPAAYQAWLLEMQPAGDTVNEVARRLPGVNIKMSGENAEAIVPRAAIFGPKLGAFFSNLSGFYDPITMDRWFMRTIGRITGTIFKDIDIDKARTRLRNVLTPGIYKIVTGDELGLRRTIDELTDDEVDGIALRIKRSAYKKLEKVYEDARTAGNHLGKALDGDLRDAPISGSQRIWIRERMANVRKMRPQYELSDIQAAMWIGEKEIFKLMGGRFQDADFYSEGAENLASKLAGESKLLRRAGRAARRIRQAAAEAEGSALFSRTRTEQARGIIDKIVATAKANPDGFTIEIADGTLIPEGFAVAPSKLTETRLDKLYDSDISEFIDDFAEVFDSDERAMLGGWYNNETGKFILDVSYVVDKLEDALYIAELGSQDAIFDIFNVKEVRTKDGISGLKQTGVYSEAKRNGLRDLQEGVHRALQASGNAIWGGAAFSRTGAEVGRTVGEGPPRPGRVGQGFDPVSGRSNVTYGVHYSEEIRDTLDSNAYGTGMPDAARLRLPGDRKSPLYQRIHIYTETPQGIRPESGVGENRHEVDLTPYKIYDLDSDVIQVDRVEGENYFNTFELEVIRRGFDGIRNPTSGHVVLLGPHKIPVKYAPGEPGATSEAPADLGAKFHLIGLDGVSALPEKEREIALDNYAIAWKMGNDKGLTRYTDDTKADWDKIFLATGWMRGVDSKWRYEIDDSAMKILPAFHNLKESTGLGRGAAHTIPLISAIDYPLLFKAYPELVNAKVIKHSPFHDKNKSWQGWWDEENNTLGVTPYATAYRLTLIHELQHAIQAREGFVGGGTPDPSLVYKAPQKLINRLANEGIKAVQDHLVQLNAALQQVQQVRAELNKLSPEKKAEFDRLANDSKALDAKIKRLAQMWDRGVRNSDLNDNPNGLLGTFAITTIEAEKTRIIKKRQALLDPSMPELIASLDADEIINNANSHEVSYLGYIARDKKMETTLTTGTDQEVRALVGAYVPADLYYAISGEVESRAAGNRALMSEQTRKTTPIKYDIPAEEQIDVGPAQMRMPSVPVPSMIAQGGNGELLPSVEKGAKFSTTGAEQEAGTSFPVPVKTLGNDLYYTFIDKMTDLRRVVAAIRNLGRDIKEELDASLRETLFSGRVAKRIEDVYEKELVPIYKKIGDYGLTKDEVEEYLHNRHAREANAYIRSLMDDDGNPIGMQDAGSGISDQQAADYLSAVPQAKRLKLEAVAKMIDDFTRKSANTLVEYGLETQDTVDQWFRKYQHYVPLFRDHVIDGNIGVGTGYSIHGQSSKQRKGSESKVVNILANIVHQRERIIVRGEKNILAKALWGLMKANPNPAFWKPAKPWIRKATDIESGEQVKVPDFHYKWADNVIMHRAIEKGKIVEHGVELNDNDPTALRMAQAMKNIDMDTLGLVLGASAKVTRFIAAMNTQYNPVFGITNFVRDTGTALLNLTTTPIAGKQKQVMNYSLKALAGIYSAMRAHRDGKPVEGEWGKLFEEFQQVGGQTGYRDLFKTMYDRSKSIEMEIKELQAGKILKGGYAIKNLLSDYNTAMENALRLASYRVGIESGMSKDAAAAMAKSLTVNFNRKGQISTQAGALYAFFNATAQGAAKVAETLMGPAGRKIIQGGLVLGVVQAMMLAAAGFGDDEPPEFVQEKNIIIPTGGKDYITIPMPLGFNVLPNIGRMTTQFALGGFERPLQKMGNLLGVVMDGFNPLGASQSLIQSISPTPIDPLVALAENKDWTGHPIYREDYSSLNPTPGFTRTKDSATFMGKGLSWGLNMLSGGTRYTPGLFSPTADQIDFLAGQFTGGVGRESAKIIQTGQTLATGEELPTWKRPVISRFYGSAEGKAVEATRFYENIKMLNLHETEIKGRIKDRKPIGEYIKDNPESRLWKVANNTENSVKKLRERKSLLISRNASKESIKAIDALIERKMKILNDQVRAMSG